MAVPLNLSDPDTDAKDLFASPSSARKKLVQQKAPKAPSPPLTDLKADSEDAREASLRRELAGIRNINEVIEGVVDSLAQAKGNMDVCFIRTYLAFLGILIVTDNIPHGEQCIDPIKYLDAHSLTNGAQSALSIKPLVAGCHSRPLRHGE